MTNLRVGQFEPLFSPSGRDIDDRIPINDKFTQPSPAKVKFEVDGKEVTYSEARKNMDNRASLKPNNNNIVENYPNTEDNLGIYRSSPIGSSNTSPRTSKVHRSNRKVSPHTPTESSSPPKSSTVHRPNRQGYIDRTGEEPTTELKTSSRIPTDPTKVHRQNQRGTSEEPKPRTSKVHGRTDEEPTKVHRPTPKVRRITRKIDDTPKDPPEDYIEGPHKIIPKMPNRPRENVVYVNRTDRPQVGIVSELPDNVDPDTVTVDQLRAYTANKRMMLVRKIAVKFNEGSLIDWSKFSNKFKARMFREINTKYYALISHNASILGNTSIYNRKFTSIEEAYEQYIELKRVVDTQWLRGVIKSGIALFYTAIGYFLDNWYEMNTGPAVNLIIQNGISNDLINRLDIGTNMTNKVMHGGGIPIIFKLLGLVIFNAILVYAVCRFIDNESTVHSVIGKLSSTASNITTTGTINMQQVAEAGGPFVSLIMSRMTAPSDAPPSATASTTASSMGTSTDDDYDVDEEE